MTSSGGIRIGKRRSHTVVYNDLLPQDQTLSARAWGIYVYLVGRPDGWECRSNHLASVFKEGRDAIRGGLNELVEAGLMVRETYLEGNLTRTRFAIPDEVSREPDSQAPEMAAQVSKEVTKTGAGRPYRPVDPNTGRTALRSHVGAAR